MIGQARRYRDEGGLRSLCFDLNSAARQTTLIESAGPPRVKKLRGPGLPPKQPFARRAR